MVEEAEEERQRASDDPGLFTMVGVWPADAPGTSNGSLGRELQHAETAKKKVVTLDTGLR